MKYAAIPYALFNLLLTYVVFWLVSLGESSSSKPISTEVFIAYIFIIFSFLIGALLPFHYFLKRSIYFLSILCLIALLGQSILYLFILIALIFDGQMELSFGNTFLSLLTITINILFFIEIDRHIRRSAKCER